MTNYQKLLFETTDEYLDIYLELYNKTKPYVNDSCDQIRDWYNSQPHLPKNALDDRFLVRFFYFCKFSVERAKDKIDMYYASRTLFPELFNNRNPYDSNIINSIKCGEYYLMPIMTKDNYRLSITRYTDYDPKFFDPISTFKFMMMVSDLRTIYDTCIGDLCIWDFTHMKLSQVLKITPTMIKKVLFVVQRCYPARIKGIHILNCPGYAQTTINVVKAVLKKKIVERIYLHNSFEDLHKHIDPKYLPKELGGTYSSTKTIIDNFINVMQSEEWTSRFAKFEIEKTDESKRPQKSDDIVGDLLGIAGSFKKLDID